MSEPTPIDERIAEMTEQQLDNLHENAERLAKTGGPAQRVEAERILPLIVAAREERRVAKAAALQEKRRLTTKAAATTRAAGTTARARKTPAK